MTEDKQSLATLLYEITDDLILESPDAEDVSIDKLLTPQQKYSLIMSILNGLPMDSFERVIDLNAAFKAPVETTHIVTEFHNRELRFNLIAEELVELGFAMGLDKSIIYGLLMNQFVVVTKKAPKASLVETLDALTDLLFVVYGAFYTFNLIPVQLMAMEEVYDSNMTKLIPNSSNALAEVKESVTELQKKGLNVISKDLKNGSIILRDKDTNKILKPLTYVKPDLETIINNHLKTK